MLPQTRGVRQEPYIFKGQFCPYTESAGRREPTGKLVCDRLDVPDGEAMRKTISAAVLLFAPLSLQAKDKPAYEKGELVQMDSTSCGYAEKDGKTLAGEIFGTDGQHKRTQETLCQEYVLRSQRITYRIRPKDDKHPSLLPIGETAEFRIHKDKLLLRVPEADGKEREYIVLSMTPRTDAAESRRGTTHVNR